VAIDPLLQYRRRLNTITRREKIGTSGARLRITADTLTFFGDHERSE